MTDINSEEASVYPVISAHKLVNVVAFPAVARKRSDAGLVGNSYGGQRAVATALAQAGSEHLLVNKTSQLRQARVCLEIPFVQKTVQDKWLYILDQVLVVCLQR